MKNKKQRKENKDIFKKLVEWLEKEAISVLNEISCKDHLLFFEKKENNLNRNSSSALMQIKENYPYKQVSIGIFPIAIELFNKGEKEILKIALIHEISHLKTNRIYEAAVDRFSSKDLIDNLNEELTESFARLLEKLLKLKNSN